MCPSKHATNISINHVGDSSALVSQRDDYTHPPKIGKGRHKCDHCGKLSHKIDMCYVLHGRPRKSTTIVQTASPVQPYTVDPIPSNTSRHPIICNEFLKWYEDRQNSSSTASIAHTTHIRTSFAGITHSNSLGPWVLNSGATNHITSNKTFFSSISTFGYLSSMTMAKVSSYGVGTINLLPSLSIDNVFYVPGFPFNLLSITRLNCSLDCVISFIKDCVCLRDQSLGWMIGTGCESHGLYHLQTSAHVGTVIDSPSLLHALLGHPSLVKMQQLVSSLSKLSNLSCKSCHLEK